MRLTRRHRIQAMITTTPGRITDEECTMRVTPKQFAREFGELRRIVGPGTAIFTKCLVNGIPIWRDYVLELASGTYDCLVFDGEDWTLEH